MHWIYAHIVGDFILQNDWMAKGKKEKSWICAVHVLTYMIPFLFCGFDWTLFAVIAMEHYLQDRYGFVKWSMLKLGKPVFCEPPMAPWSIILMDQFYHILFMAGMVYWYSVGISMPAVTTVVIGLTLSGRILRSL